MLVSASFEPYLLFLARRCRSVASNAAKKRKVFLLVGFTRCYARHDRWEVFPSKIQLRIQLYSTQVLGFVLLLSARVWSVRVDEGQMISVGNAELLSSRYVSQGAVNH